MNSHINRTTQIRDIGLTDYQQALDYQTELFSSILSVKSSNKNLSPEQQCPTPNFLVLCQHPHVYTLGRNGEQNNLLLDREGLNGINAGYYHTSRGGDITYHGPGQLVVYPIIDLENFFTDIHKYMRLLEEAVIQTLSHFGVKAGRMEGLTGVWCGVDDEKTARKICAMGVKTSRWVTMHGLALNIDPDLAYFNHIIACGIADKGVTSMAKENSSTLNVNDVIAVICEKIGTLFEMDIVKEVSHDL